MVFTDLSPSMNLPVPEVGIDPGPTYAQDVNNCLTIIDGHNHSPGYGVQITPSGLNINADLTFINNNLTNARSVRFFSQNAVLSNPADLGCLYEVGADLYFNDGVGNQIRITQSGGVAGTPGSIANLTPPASASYVSLNSTFVWQSAANTAANMDAGSIILRNLTTNSFGLTLSPPNALGADYDITLPSLPGSNLPVSIDNSGTMSAAPITFSQLDSTLQTAVTKIAPTKQILTAASGTYVTPSPAPLYIKVTVVGPGGNGSNTGGGGPTGGGGGGGGGGAAIKQINSPSASYPFVVGVPGTNSSFDTTVIGGAGGDGVLTSGGNGGGGGAGGVGSGGDINFTGQGGMGGVSGIPADIGGSGGVGGSAALGFGGGGASSGITDTPGGNGGLYGGGGSGANYSSSPVAGTGAQGVIIVEEFYQ